MANIKQENAQPKMKPFKTIQENFAVIGITPKLLTQSYPFNWRIFIALLEIGVGVGFVGMYVIKDANTFIEYTQSIFWASVAALVIVILLCIIIKVKKLFEFVDRNDTMINTKFKYSATQSIYYETNQFEEKLSKIVFFIMVDVTPVCAIVPWAMYIYFVYFTTDLGPDAFECPCPIWFPFDWKTPLGYAFAMTIQYVMLSRGEMIGACVLILSIVAYMYGVAANKCMKGSLFAINHNAQSKFNRSHLFEQLVEFIDMYSIARKVTTNFSDIVNHIISILLMCSLVVMSGSLLMIQIQLTNLEANQTDNLAVLLVTTIESFYAFGVMFIACELGQRISISYEECSEMINQFDWYLLPAEIQQMLPTIIGFTQQSVEITCFGSAACDRETFKYVIKTAFSYFTMLRQFYN